METKRCPKCEAVLPLSEFHRNAAQRDGYSPYCKTCKRGSYVSSAQSKESSRAFSRDYAREKRTTDPAHLHQLKSESYRRHAEKYKAKQRAYSASNKALISQRGKEYRLRNIEAYRARSAEKNARRYAAPGKFTGEDVKAKILLQENKCFWCGIELDKTYQADHVIPLCKGGTNWPFNIVITCRLCNQRKHDLMPMDWLKRLNEFYK